MAKDLNYIYEKRDTFDGLNNDQVGAFNSYSIKIRGANSKIVPFLLCE
jgi:hypothetical protein